MERDYWKLREIETRYRLLFTSSRDAVLLLDSSDLSVLELNPAAGHALGLPANRPRSASSVQFTELLLPEERGSFEKLLRQVRERGKAPGILLRLGASRETWLARASLMASALAEVFLLQLSPSSGAGLGQDVRDGVPVETLVERAPDGFVAIDGQGTILRANRTFLDLAQVGSEAAVVGEPLGRWLGRPGADIAVLLANVMRLGAVRLLSTTLHGELGSENEVEISACGSSQTDPSFIGVFVRDVGRRLAAPPPGDEINQLLNSLTKQIGKTSLRKLVEDTIRILEQHYIHAALGLTGGNRTATAELLGLSRQSLYVKLNRYGLDGDDKPESGS
jgi:transcriptional regulator PpsR